MLENMTEDKLEIMRIHKLNEVNTSEVGLFYNTTEPTRGL